MDEHTYPPGVIEVVELSPTDSGKTDDSTKDQRQSVFATVVLESSTGGAGPSSSPAIANNTSSENSRSTNKRPRFAIFRRQSSTSGSFRPVDGSSKTVNGKTGSRRNSKRGLMTSEEDEEWENNWEKSEFPFIRLEGNRAACAICLMDFAEPPKRKNAEATDSSSHPPPAAAVGQPNSEPNPGKTESVNEGEAELEPLRLLECGHVFHVRDISTSFHSVI